MKTEVTKCVSLGAFLGLFAGVCSYSHANNSSEQSSTLADSRVAVSLDHSYTSGQLATLFGRPKTVPQLLTNLKLAWDMKLLLQPAFYEDSSLLRFFNASAVSWEPAQIPDPDWIIRIGKLELEQSAFPDVTVALRYSRRVTRKQSAPGVGVDVPANTEDSGQITMNVESVPGFTWGVTKSAFGPNATQRGRGENYHGGRSTPLTFKVEMQYLYPDEDVAKFGASDLPGTWFLLKQGAIAPAPGKSVEPQDSDIVESLRMYIAVKK